MQLISAAIMIIGLTAVIARPAIASPSDMILECEGNGGTVSKENPEPAHKSMSFKIDLKTGFGGSRYVVGEGDIYGVYNEGAASSNGRSLQVSAAQITLSSNAPSVQIFTSLIIDLNTRLFTYVATWHKPSWESRTSVEGQCQRMPAEFVFD